MIKSVKRLEIGGKSRRSELESEVEVKSEVRGCDCNVIFKEKEAKIKHLNFK